MFLSSLRTFSLFVLFAITTSVLAEERYLLNPGDILDISVWNEESLRKQLIILPDGMISFPLGGELVAQGKSISELQSALTEKLSQYLADPVVTVSVASVDGNMIHIMGKVLKPGNFVMNRPLDVMQALSMAGGLSPYAEENNIIVLRRVADAQNVLPVHYASIKKGKELETNIMLKSGDVIVVP